MPKSTVSIIFCVIILFACFQAYAQEEDDDDFVKIDSSLVVLNASIIDSNGLAVLGLNKNQFKVFEDGVEQKVDIFESEEAPFAAVLLLDTSGSMEERISFARSAAINFLDGLRADDRVAIYNFDTNFSMVQDFSNSRDITHKVFDLKADGWTALNDAIYEASGLLANRPEKRKAIVILSDGADTRSRKSASKALKAALAVDATIYTVDMSAMDSSGRERFQNQGALKNFANKTGGLFIATPGGAALRKAFENIAKELGNQYTLGYQPSNAAKDGKWRNIELRVARPNLTIRTRKGYQANKQN